MNILVTGAGGPATLSFVRSLRLAYPKQYNIIGIDAGKYNCFRSEADKTYLCPRATDENYIPFLQYIIEKEGIDFLHAQPEIEIYTIGKHREDLLPCSLFLPKQETIELLRDKWKSYCVWRDAGIKVPKSYEINNTFLLQKAHQEFKKNGIWLRAKTGAAGRLSLSRPHYQEAVLHIDKHNAWGEMMVAEHLTDKTITWQSIWWLGELVVGQGRKRLYWEFANRAQSGVTGLTGTGVTVSDPELDELAIRCIHAADPEPHGIFSVDFTFDWDGVPNPTEINIGKFFTTHYFLSRAGCNMPEIVTDLVRGKYEGDFDIRNPCKEEMYWIRGIDVVPRLVSASEILELERTYVEQIGLIT